MFFDIFYMYSVWYHIYIRKPKIKKTGDKSWWGYGKNETFIDDFGDVKWCNCLEKCLNSLQEINLRVTILLPLLGIYLPESVLCCYSRILYTR